MTAALVYLCALVADLYAPGARIGLVLAALRLAALVLGVAATDGRPVRRLGFVVLLAIEIAAIAGEHAPRALLVRAGLAALLISPRLPPVRAREQAAALRDVALALELRVVLALATAIGTSVALGFARDQVTEIVFVVLALPALYSAIVLARASARLGAIGWLFTFALALETLQLLAAYRAWAAFDSSRAAHALGALTAVGPIANVLALGALAAFAARSARRYDGGIEIAVLAVGFTGLAALIQIPVSDDGQPFAVVALGIAQLFLPGMMVPLLRRTAERLDEALPEAYPLTLPAVSPPTSERCST